MEDILVTVKTYPEISKKYRETVCTAGILKSTKKLVRIYPIRYRYLDGEQKFKKYQWIKADISKGSKDYRPESYNVIPDSIELGAHIGTQNSWQERCAWVLNENTVFRSVENLQKHREEFGVSLGLVKPKKVLDFKIKRKTQDEIDGSLRKKKLAYQQLDLFEKDDSSLEILKHRFYLKFECDDEGCSRHEMSILDWEIAQLYRRLRGDANWEAKLRSKIMDEIFGAKKETFLFLGNMALRHHIFCILGFFYPPRERPLPLF